MSRTRPLARDCQRLTSGDLRALVAPDATEHRLSDGTLLRLRWRAVRGCFGGGEGRALVLLCPQCGTPGRVLWRPPAGDWGCWRCCPVSHPSHRRSGSRAGRSKPISWHLEQIAAEQMRAADLLGLEAWPPKRLLWDREALAQEPRWPDAPRLSRAREQALLARLDALETLRLALVVPGVCAELEALGCSVPKWSGMEKQALTAEQVVTATAWALRRPARDPRTLQRRGPSPPG